MPQDWGFYEVVVSVVGVFLTLIGAGWTLHERRKNSKGLQYFLSNELPLTNYPDKRFFEQGLFKRVGKEIYAPSWELILKVPEAWKFKVFFNEEEAKHPHITIIDIVNTSRTPITPEDFRDPLTYRVGEKTKILTVSKFSSRPNDLEPVYEVFEDKIVVSPLLLNGGDGFRTSIITDRYPKLEVSARVVGVPQIRRYTHTKWAVRILLPIILSAGILMIILAVLDFIGIDDTWIGPVLGILFIIFVFWNMWTSGKIIPD